MDETVINNKLTDVTFVIPVRIDSPLRTRNLDVLIDFLLRNFDSKILVMETDSCQRYFAKKRDSRLQYFFEEDTRPVFHHTRCMNLLYRKVDTPVIAGWDVDALVSPEQIVDTVEQVRRGNAVMGLAYDGYMYCTTAELARIYQDTQNFDVLIQKTGDLHTMCGDLSTGGAFIVDAKK